MIRDDQNHRMKNTLISWKRASVIGVMVLAGLLAGSAARAEVMTFYAAGPNGKAVNAAYQPVTNVHIGYLCCQCL